MASSETLLYSLMSYSVKRLYVLSGKMSGFSGYVDANISAINNVRTTFSASPNAGIYLSTFKESVSEYIFDFDSGSSGESGFIDNLYNIKYLEGGGIITTNPSFLKMVGLTSWEDLLDYEYTPPVIVTSLADYLMLGTIYRALNEYSCLELYIGVNIAIIKYNLYMYTMGDLIEEYNILKDNLGEDFQSTYDKIDQSLIDSFLDANGEFSYAYALEGIPNTSHFNIKGFERIFTFIFNANKNAIFRKTGFNNTFINIDVEELTSVT
jgi:hypothetical protein